MRRLLFALLIAQPAFAQKPVDQPGTHEPPGMTTIIDSRGDDKYFGKGKPPSAGERWTVGPITFFAGYTDNAVAVVDDPSAPFGKAIQRGYPSGSRQGFRGMVIIRAGPVREFYARSTMMYSPGWQSMADKWFYFGSNAVTNNFYFGISPGGTLQFHAQGGGPGTVPGPDGPSRWSGVYRTRVPITFGTYHTLEVHAIAQSAPGVADGSLRVWFDGKLVTGWARQGGGGGVKNELTNMNFFDVGTTNADKMKFGAFQCCLYWGGTGVKARDDWVRQAEFKVSVR